MAAERRHIQIVEAPYDDLYSKLVTAFKKNDLTYDLTRWTTRGCRSSAPTARCPTLVHWADSDPDVAQVVWDVGTWPPPRGPVPPSEKSKPKQLLGVTIVGNVEMFMYRNDLTSKAPATYDDVLTNAKAQNKSGSVAGYIIRGKATNPVVADFLPILWSQGGDVFDENWNVVLDNAASKAAINFLVNDLKGVAQTDRAAATRRIATRSWPTARATSSVWPGEINTAVLDPPSRRSPVR
jgi:multiple sugar transport system substrate-binding protein